MSRRGEARREYCRIVKGLDAVWAHFRPSKPCLPLSIDGILLTNHHIFCTFLLNCNAKEDIVGYISSWVDGIPSVDDQTNVIRLLDHPYARVDGNYYILYFRHGEEEWLLCTAADNPE